MKVFLNYQDSTDRANDKTLKITLPKSWKTGPTSQLLDQFVESYNKGKEGVEGSFVLDNNEIHFEIKSGDVRRVEIASDDIISDVFEDRQDVYVMHGPSKSRSELGPLPPLKEESNSSTKEAAEESDTSGKVPSSSSTTNGSNGEDKKNLAACVHFGCQNRFPKGGPYPQNCVYHKSPPIFHETAKYWSCCPHKKAYDWDEFQAIPGCQTGTCTDQKEEGTKTFLGGCDVRDAMGENGGPALKSIDDFNKSQQNGKKHTITQLRSILADMDVENELFDQVVDGIKSELQKEHGDSSSNNEADLYAAIQKSLGQRLKNLFKEIAVQQLRIN